MTTITRTVAIIGAGPVGLAAAAHALARGLQPIVLEKGDSVGHAVRQWAHVPMFSPWAFNIDSASRRLLEDEGWTPPDAGSHPTGGDLIRSYLAPLARIPALAAVLNLGMEVVHLGRAGIDKVKTGGREACPFEIVTRQQGREVRILADAVIDTSGTWSGPSPAGPGGYPATGEREAAPRVSYGMPDVRGAARQRFSGRRIAVIGGGHSAIGTLIELAALAAEAPGTQVLWLYRGPHIAKAFGGGAADKLAARGALGAHVAQLIDEGRVTVRTGFLTDRMDTISAGNGTCIAITEAGPAQRRETVDEVVVATGFRPDTAMFRELRVSLDPALECTPVLAPLIDPNLHSCGTVRPHGAAELRHPEPGFYIAGMKSYGRAPTFLLATGYEQVRSIIAEIAGDAEAARRVELVLPETGVCALPENARKAEPDSGISAPAASCCGGPPVAAKDACCRADEIAKAETGAGCGCASGRSADAAAPAMTPA